MVQMKFVTSIQYPNKKSWKLYWQNKCEDTIKEWQIFFKNTLYMGSQCPLYKGYNCVGYVLSKIVDFLQSNPQAFCFMDNIE